jgi:hypothetical protein
MKWEVIDSGQNKRHIVEADTVAPDGDYIIFWKNGTKSGVFNIPSSVVAGFYKPIAFTPEKTQLKAHPDTVAIASNRPGNLVDYEPLSPNPIKDNPQASKVSDN